MDYEWDPAKNDLNEAKHGLRFEQMAHFEWDYALLLDCETVDGEERQLIIGPIAANLIAVITTDRNDRLRVISMRVATNHEKALWRQEFYND